MHEQCEDHWLDFHESLCWRILQRIIKSLNYYLDWTIRTTTLYKDKHAPCVYLGCNWLVFVGAKDVLGMNSREK
jgi:hypothetical protein